VLQIRRNRGAQAYNQLKKAQNRRQSGEIRPQTRDFQADQG